jgi:predicted aldo/keto reductase-like oxidoreductase
MIQICYNLFFQHPYDPRRPFGTLFEAEKKGMGIAVMRPTTSGLFQKWIAAVNPANTFDYTRSLIQFSFSNPLVDVVLIGMRSAERVVQNVEICNDTQGRIEIKDIYEYYV